MHYRWHPSWPLVFYNSLSTVLPTYGRQRHNSEGLDDLSAPVSLNRAPFRCYLPPHSTL